jgi:hypothetical protein
MLFEHNPRWGLSLATSGDITLAIDSRGIRPMRRSVRAFSSRWPPLCALVIERSYAEDLAPRPALASGRWTPPYVPTLCDGGSGTSDQARMFLGSESEAGEDRRSGVGTLGIGPH